MPVHNDEDQSLDGHKKVTPDVKTKKMAATWFGRYDEKNDFFHDSDDDYSKKKLKWIS